MTRTAIAPKIEPNTIPATLLLASLAAKALCVTRGLVGAVVVAVAVGLSCGTMMSVGPSSGTDVMALPSWYRSRILMCRVLSAEFGIRSVYGSKLVIVYQPFEAPPILPDWFFPPLARLPRSRDREAFTL